MRVQVAMPRLSDSMEDGTLLKWLIEPGQAVGIGDDLVEIETDKATMTYQAEAAGLLEILVEEGETVAVDTPIARLGDGGPTPELSPAAAAPEPPPSAPVAEPPAADGGTTAIATPLARRAAQIHGIAIEGIAGSGPRGRITKSDVLSAAGVETPAPATAPAPPLEVVVAAAVEGAKGQSRIEEPTRLQATIARRMAEAKATIPDFQVQTEVAADAAIALRRTLKEAAADGRAPSLNDVIVKATAMALREHPKANASYRNSSFEFHERINVGVAVAAEGALVVPVVADADRRSLAEIGAEVRRLAERVRSSQVTPPELSGGTFTVSNLGMFGMTAITPVINQPQAAILGVGMAREVLRRGPGGEIEDASLLTLTLSCDHRILYGSEASEFLATVRRLLEQPLLML